MNKITRKLYLEEKIAILDKIKPLRQYTSLRKLAELTNVSKSTIGKLLENELQLRLAWKVKNGTVSNINKIKKRLCLEEKIAILDKIKPLRQYTSQRKLAELTNVPKSTIGRLLENEIQLRLASKVENQINTSIPTEISLALNEALSHWYSDAYKSGGKVSDEMLKEKLEELAKNEGLEDFEATDIWISKWKDRHSEIIRNNVTKRFNNKTDDLLCNCKWLCNSSNLESEKFDLLKKFNQLTHTQQDSVIEEGIKIIKSGKRFVEKPSNISYWITLANGKEILVCRKAFCDVYKLDNKRVDLIMKQKKEKIKFHEEESQDVTDDIKYLIKEHILSFTKQEIQDNQEKMSIDLNLKIMHRLFIENNPKVNLSYKSYILVFKTNLSTFNFQSIRFEKCAFNNDDEITIIFNETKSKRLNAELESDQETTSEQELDKETNAKLELDQETEIKSRVMQHNCKVEDKNSDSEKESYEEEMEHVTVKEEPLSDSELLLTDPLTNSNDSKSKLRNDQYADELVDDNWDDNFDHNGEYKNSDNEKESYEEEIKQVLIKEELLSDKSELNQDELSNSNELRKRQLLTDSSTNFIHSGSKLRKTNGYNHEPVKQHNFKVEDKNSDIEEELYEEEMEYVTVKEEPINDYFELSQNG